jgi:hypothetical protein
MLRRQAIEALAAAAAAILITAVIAAPLMRAPSERLFGAELVGRHHDPFTVIRQFTAPMSVGMYSQPVTDLTGAAIARVTGPVAAYNWLVLLTFPLSAAAAYLLARHLALSRGGALLAALLFAFSPFHLAHAAYHPHIAQTQWLPLYLLALWRCLDAATWRAVLFLIAAAVLVTLSNFYGGLIAAVLTPVAIAAYSMWRARLRPRAARSLAVTCGALASVAAAGVAFIVWRAPALAADPEAFAFAREDLFRYSAKWWAYLVPPAVHPLLGRFARDIWTASGVNEGLLEQQVSLGWGVVALGLIAIYGWAAHKHTERKGVRPHFGPDPAEMGSDPFSPGLEAAADRAVPIAAAVAIAALVCSLSPERSIFGVVVTRPSALLYSIAPMFRAYARFGAIVQLMAALLAGVGLMRLLERGTKPASVVGAVLVTLAIAEYAVWPPALSRDVLPTEAHRWAMRQDAAWRVVDCQPLTAESASVSWLTGGRIGMLDSRFEACAEADAPARLAAAGFTHMIVRDAESREWFLAQAHREGIRLEAHFADADVFALPSRERLLGRPASAGLTR